MKTTKAILREVDTALTYKRINARVAEQVVSLANQTEKQIEELVAACDWASRAEHHPACQSKKKGEDYCNCHVLACRKAVANTDNDPVYLDFTITKSDIKRTKELFGKK